MNSKIEYFFKNTKLQILVISILTTLSFLNILGNEFVIDDKGFFLQWELLRDVKNIPLFFTKEGLLLEGNPPLGYRPVRTVLMSVAYQIFGQNPGGYHLLGIFLHLIITLLVYLIAKQLLVNAKTKKWSNIPFIASLAFGVHPIHTEVVSFITNNFYLFGYIFYLTSFLLYIKSPLGKVSGKYLLAIFLGLLAFFTYEAMLSLVLVIIFYDFIYRKLKVINYLPFILSAGIFFLVHFFLVQVIPKGSSYLEMGSYYLILSSVKAFARYIYLLFMPINLSLDPYVGGGLYSHSTALEIVENLKQHSFFDLTTLIPILLVAMLIFLTIRFWKTNKIIPFSIGWFFLTFLPTSNIVLTADIMQDRFMYLPSLGFCLILGLIIIYLAEYLAKKININKNILIILLLPYILFYSYRTIIRNQDWKNDITLNKSVSESSPKNYLQHYNLGVRYYNAGEYQLASQAYLKTISVRPDFWAAHFNLANIYLHFGYKKEAILEYQKTLQLNPEYLPAKERLEKLSNNESTKN